MLNKQFLLSYNRSMVVFVYLIFNCLEIYFYEFWSYSRCLSLILSLPYYLSLFVSLFICAYQCHTLNLTAVLLFLLWWHSCFIKLVSNMSKCLLYSIWYIFLTYVSVTYYFDIKRVIMHLFITFLHYTNTMFLHISF